MVRAIYLLIGILAALPVAAEGISDGSLARSARLPFELELQSGDVIVRIDGKSYGGPALAHRALVHGTGGRRLRLEIRRAGTIREVRIDVPAAPFEDIAGVTSHYSSFVTEDGLRLRTITTRPKSAKGRLPAIYFVQWLSCDSIEYPLNPDDHGWQQMLQLLAARSGVVMMRTDKSGSGDSEGDCADLDYDTELAHHRQALDRLIADSEVDPSRVVIFGASMGGNMAALLAAERRPAGLVIWGTAIKTWLEHLVMFNRRNLELSGRPPGEIAGLVSRQVSFFEEFLIAGKSPGEIADADAALGSVWGEIRGSSGATLYGRPYRFHRQAQAKDWLAAIASVRAPTLVLYGEFDWYEELDDHVLITRVIERSRPGGARLAVVPRMDHHFSIYPTLEAAFLREGGFVAPERPVMEIVDWLRSVVGPTG